MQTLTVVYRAPAELKRYPHNIKKHPAEQIAALAALVKEVGFNVPISHDEDDVILAGHGRLDVAEYLGLESVPCILVPGLTEAQKRTWRIADNKLPEKSHWDAENMRLELGAIRSMNLNLTLTGFSLGEIDKIFAHRASRKTDPDELPSPTDVPKIPVSAPGAVWLMGDHRLCCGDSTSQDAVGELMAGNEAGLCFTSPPYSGQRRYGGSEIDDWEGLMQGVFSTMQVTGDAQVLVNLGLIHSDHEWQPYWNSWIEFMRAAGWRRFGFYVWDQMESLSGDFRGRLPPSHEFIFHFNRESPRVRKTHTSKHAGKMSKGMLRSGEATFTGLRAKGATEIQATKKMDSVIRVTRHKGSIGKGIDHPAVFPVGLPAEIISAFTDPSDIVYDPFCGAGTTLLACEQLGRAGFGMELQPKYCDIAVIRWQRFTGRQAVREADGLTFDALAAESLSPA